MNIESADLKPDPINSCTHNARICSQQQLKTIVAADLREVYRHVWFEDSHGLEDHIL
jgi:hypothetical protein